MHILKWTPGQEYAISELPFTSARPTVNCEWTKICIWIELIFILKALHWGLGLKQRRKATRKSPISQSCTGTKSEKFWWATGQSNLAYKRLAATKPSRVWFSYSTQLLWPMEQSSILSAKFACPVARQNISLLATAHDCETDLSHSRLCAIRCLALKVRQ